MSVGVAMLPLVRRMLTVEILFVPQAARRDPALAVYADTALATIQFSLTVQDLVMGMLIVGESRQCALHWTARATCADGITSITTHGPH